MPKGTPAGAAGPGQVTIYDVARLAGVSASTVSHVINRTRRVGAPTRERVQAAIATLGYERNALANALASGLRGRRTRTLGLLLPELSNPIAVDVARGVEAVAGDAGYGLVLCNTEEQPKKQRAYIRMLLEHQVAGILVNPVNGTTEDIARLQARDIPLVTLGCTAATLALDSVRLDYAMGGRQAVEHLLSRGHRRIAALLSHPDRMHPVVVERRRGYEAALRAAGIEPDPALELLSADTVDDARDVVLAHLTSGRAPFTAAIAFKPLPALGLLVALREKGLDVPGDVSVIGFGDAEWMRAYPPPITAVDQPNYQVGREAAGLLLRRIEAAQQVVAEAGTERTAGSADPASRPGALGHPGPAEPVAQSEDNGAGVAPTIVHVATRLIERASVRQRRD
jgi:LacI family transcriptional regulator